MHALDTLICATRPECPGTSGSGRSVITILIWSRVKYGMPCHVDNNKSFPLDVLKVTRSPHETSHHLSVNQPQGARSISSSPPLLDTSANGIPLGPVIVLQGVSVPFANRIVSVISSSHSVAYFNHTFAQLSNPVAPAGKSGVSVEAAAA